MNFLPNTNEFVEILVLCKINIVSPTNTATMLPPFCGYAAAAMLLLCCWYAAATIWSLFFIISKMN
jgi:hypothetical protein